MNLRRLTLVSVLVVVVALISASTAFGKEIIQVSISGPGLNEAIVLKDADQLALFQDFQFERMLKQPPVELGSEYFEVRLAIGDGSQIVATNVYHYFPGINTDYGYMYYADVEGGSSSIEGQWFELTDTMDRQLRHSLRDAGVRFGVSADICVVATPEAST